MAFYVANTKCFSFVLYYIAPSRGYKNANKRRWLLVTLPNIYKADYVATSPPDTETYGCIWPL